MWILDFPLFTPKKNPDTQQPDEKESNKYYV